MLAEALELEKALVTTLLLARIVIVIVARNRNGYLYYFTRCS